MSAIINGSAILLLLLLYLCESKCLSITENLEKWEQMLAQAKTLRSTRDSETISPIWQEYEFGTGAGNREELVVTNISVHKYEDLPDTEINWQYFEANGSNYLASTGKSVLSLYRLNLDDAYTNNPVTLNIDGVILTFKIISLSRAYPQNLNSEGDVVAVLCVETDKGTFLQWYRVFDTYFQVFWIWPVQKQIKDLEFIQRGNQSKLFLLDDNEMHFGKQYSPIHVYGFSIDFSNNDYHFWLCQRILVPKTFDIQVCSIYEGISLALQGINEVFLYKYRDTVVGNLFQMLQVIKSHDLKNFVCFESGYVQYLAISGPEAGLFNFFEDEFQFNTESESSFEITEISWIQDIRMDTYRDESLLLFQLKNTTVIALAWYGSGFKKIQLPSNVLEQFDLSRITVIPKFGFVYGNQFVKFDTTLKDFDNPLQDGTKEMPKTKTLLNVVLQNQERIIDETEARIEKSYFKNPTISGFWNLTNVNATNALLKDNVSHNSITLQHAATKNQELIFDISLPMKIQSLEQKLEEIDSNLKKLLNSNLTGETSYSNINIHGNINVNGTLNVKNLIVKYLNDAVINDSIIHAENAIRNDEEFFTSITADNLTITSVNGIPIGEIYLYNSAKDYSMIDFSKVDQAVIKEHLHFSSINGINWERTMQNVVRKDKSANISGQTIVEGTIISDEVMVEHVQNLSYPEDYFLNNAAIPVEITGFKSFDKLSVTNLNTNTLNNIDIADFIVTNDDNTLKEEITFENLTIEGPFQIDGIIEGIDIKNYFVVNETSEILSNLTIANLTVLGNIIVENSIADRTSTDFEDILLKTDSDVEITGTKAFLNDVEIAGNLTIKFAMINGHPIDEFVTVDTEQNLTNLEKISANISIGNIVFEATKKFETLLNKSKNINDACLDEVIFDSPIILDELSFDTLRSNVSEKIFTQKLNETFQTAQFDLITVEKLMADEILPKLINNMSFANFGERLMNLNVMDNVTIENLQIDTLHAEVINGMSMDELNSLKEKFEKLHKQISDGNVSFDSLRVTGKINSPLINDVALENLYTKDQMGTVIFEKDISIENLRILGLTNNFNFSKYVADAVLKNERDIVVTGRKMFDKINCQYLELSSFNGHPVENIFDPSKKQVLAGVTVVNGSVTVTRSFDGNGKIGDISFHDLTNRFKLKNNSYELNGHFDFTNNVSVTNFYTNGFIQEKSFKMFLETTIKTHDNNVTISGTKVFENPINFNGTLTVYDILNDLNLQKFYEKAVFVNESFSVQSKINFVESVNIEETVVVKTNFETKTIMGVDMVELELNVLYLNRPTYVSDSLTFSDVNFQSNINAEKINDLDMTLLIPLHTAQTLPVILKCLNVYGEDLQIQMVNGYNLDSLKRDTFMMFEEQDITGHITFHRTVHARHNFNGRFINGIDFKQIIMLSGNDTLSGNLIFKKPIFLNQSLRVLGHLNGINPTRWQAVAVTTSFPLRQIISGKWIVKGNIYFENGAFGSDILNGINVTKTLDALVQTDLEIDDIVAEANMNIENMCQDLNTLKVDAERQIYKFNAFDYLQILEFDKNITSVYYFELENLDYLLISYDNCHMEAFQFNGMKFESVVNVSDFGSVDQWASFTHDKVLYFLTIGKTSCGRSPGNLWKLEDDEFQHVLDLGNVNEKEETGSDAFVTLVQNYVDKKSTEQDNRESVESIASSFVNYKNSNFISDNDPLLLSNRKSAYEYKIGGQKISRSESCFGSTEVLRFKAGIYEKELSICYDERVSKNYIFVCNSNTKEKNIVQTIKVYKPSFFTILNFEGLIETLLVFVENRRNVRIYEYLGIEGFVFRDVITLNVNKLFDFKIRKYRNLAKRQCLALIHENRLIILEAKMYGEKLDMKMLSCRKN